MIGRRRLAELRELQLEVAIMRSALGFYAAESNWRRRPIHARGEPVRWEKSPAAKDRGAAARQALQAANAAMVKPKRGALRQRLTRLLARSRVAAPAARGALSSPRLHTDTD